MSCLVHKSISLAVNNEIGIQQKIDFVAKLLLIQPFIYKQNPV